MEFPGRQFRNHAASANFPDLMNDSAYDTNRRGKEREHDEQDTCRICRGEATEQDQLYHPCKCSGSIKFVHQPCLVQWLAHSQKKHCELCKTPFQFTKVYDPNMPESLPTVLLAKQLLKHSFRTVITWLRWVLVAFVWLGWLPWSMRAIWRALFWLAEGRWTGGDAVQQALSESLVGLNVSSSLNETLLPRSSVGVAVLSNSTEGQSPLSPAPSLFGFSAGEPLLLTLMKKLLAILLFSGESKPRRPSLLSDVKFLNSLSPYPTINNIVIDTLEGQLITSLVVISFILIFLIREWVVQQQPLDIIADGEREAAERLIANNRPAQQAEAPGPEPRAVWPGEDIPPNREVNPHAEEADEHTNTERPRAGTESGIFNEESMGQDELSGLGNLVTEGLDIPGSLRNRENNNGLDLNAPAWPRSLRDKEIAIGLWLRTDGDLEEMLRIIQEEGRQDELSWLVTSLNKMLHDDDSRLSITSVLDFPVPPDSGPLGNSDGLGLGSPSQDRNESHSFTPVDSNLSPDTPSSSRFALDPSIQAPQESSSRLQDTDLEDVTEQGMLQSLVRPEDAVGDSASRSSDLDASGGILTTGTGSVGNSQSTLETSQNIAEPPKSLTRRALDWFWADIPDDQDQGRQQEENEFVDEPVIEAPIAHAPNHGNLVDGGAPGDPAPPADLDVDANDLDAIEEGDDLEGILELIGMQGPIANLFQNGVFCTLLISFTVTAGIWLPYLAGKIALVLLANPIQFILGVPMTAVSIFADVVLDTLIGSLGYIMYWTSLICKVILSPFGALAPLGEWTVPITNASLSLIGASSQRLGNVMSTFFVFHEADVPMFSVISHQALKIHEARITSFARSLYLLSKFVLYDLPLRIGCLEFSKVLSFDSGAAAIGSALTAIQDQVYESGRNIYTGALNSTMNTIVTGLVSSNGTIDYELAVWHSKDRIIAILMGYLLASAIGLAYLRIARFISGAERGQRVEGLAAEALHQAGGVMKVILIIGIEMIVFPLYCGALLDIALLPLFENATLVSRIKFTSSHPLTSLFVHWFVGTCYMFHFALFVAMCRKIMRSGVLYFIRDPDDPTFHPVRDVLERNITTQLRKIAFSALVYGALVIVCLGGVVWGLYYGFDGILPIRWSSRDLILEAPIDLLLYNLGIPLAIRAFKPSDMLHSLYSWWFRRCARLLRLSHFFFGEKHLDEEVHHGPHTWQGFFSASKAGLQRFMTEKDQQSDSNDKHPGSESKRDGRFVRAPASDQVRIPKGSQVFLEVTEANERIDGAPDNDHGLHGRQNDMFTMVYIPPFFRTRIGVFILLIWMFAAATGVGTTVLPLAIGRSIMSSYFPGRPVNDVYSFSVGMGLVCAAAWVLMFCRTCFGMVKGRLGAYLCSPRLAFRGLANALVRGMSLVYIAVSFSVILPLIFALAIELYLLVPAQTYQGADQRHVINFVQDWANGVIYVRMAVRLALWNSRSRPAAVLKGIFRDGWLKPNVKLATKALLLPMTLLATVAFVLPLCFGFVFNSTVFSSDPDVHPKVYRYAYPVTLSMGLMVWLAYLVCRQVEVWRATIRDDFYLIGERLHNFRDKRAPEVSVPRRVITG